MLYVCVKERKLHHALKESFNVTVSRLWVEDLAASSGKKAYCKEHSIFFSPFIDHI